jgi:hypothetical protein
VYNLWSRKRPIPALAYAQTYGTSACDGKRLNDCTSRHLYCQALATLSETQILQIRVLKMQLLCDQTMERRSSTDAAAFLNISICSTQRLSSASSSKSVSKRRRPFSVTTRTTSIPHRVEDTSSQGTRTSPCKSPSSEPSNYKKHTKHDQPDWTACSNGSDTASP